MTPSVLLLWSLPHHTSEPQLLSNGRRGTCRQKASPLVNPRQPFGHAVADCTSLQNPTDLRVDPPTSGSHRCCGDANCVLGKPRPFQLPFFSEYVEGSAKQFNRVVQVQNVLCSGAPVSLLVHQKFLGNETGRMRSADLFWILERKTILSR
jgi:hypothetical protein